MTVQESILTKILDCGTCDLSLLEDINYDLDNILDDLMDNGNLNINSIFMEVFRAGALNLKEEFEMQKDEIRNMILKALEEEKELVTDGEMTQEELEKCEEHLELIQDLERLESGELDPEDGLDYYINYIDTYVFMKHIDFYRRWMKSEVDNIEYNMGWTFREAA